MAPEGSLVWRQRSRHYLVGVAGLAVAIVLYIIGHVAPYWVTNANLHLRIGLWFRCTDNEGCTMYNFSADPDFFKAIRILQLICLLGLFLAVAAAIFANCRRQHPGPSYALEVIISASALIGLSGPMTFLYCTLSDITDFSFLHYDWAFALNVAACGLALLAAAVIFFPKLRCCHKNRDNNSSAGSVAFSTTATVVGGPKFSSSAAPYARDFRRMDGAEDTGEHREFANGRGGPYGFDHADGRGSHHANNHYYGRTLAAGNRGPSSTIGGGGPGMGDGGGRYGNHHDPHYPYHHSNGRMLHGNNGPAAMSRSHLSGSSLYDNGNYAYIMDDEQQNHHFFHDVPLRDYDDPDYRNNLYVSDPTSSGPSHHRGLASPTPYARAGVTAFRSSNANPNGALRSSELSQGGPDLTSARGNWREPDGSDPTWHTGGHYEQQRGTDGGGDGYRYSGDGGTVEYSPPSSPSRFAPPLPHHQQQQSQMMELSPFRLPRIALRGQFESRHLENSMI